MEKYKCAECGNNTEDCSTWYREDENETVCEDCYMEFIKNNHNSYKKRLLNIVDYFENIADQSGLLEDMEHLPKAKDLRDFINNRL